MDATMVTGLFKIETDAKLAASDNYHKTAMEHGLVQFHYRIIEATMGAMKYSGRHPFVKGKLP